MAILLAIGAAVGWGASDYLGGNASRRATPVFVIVAITELFGLASLLPILIARGTPPPADPRLLFALLAGVAVTVELGLIYRALGRGQGFITAPIGALGSAVAVTAGLVGGDPLSLAVALGLAAALLGGGIAALTSPSARAARIARRETGMICVGAAAAVGTMLVALHEAGRLDPYWATATEHAGTALSAAVSALFAARGPLRRALPRPRQLPALALIAAAGTGGDLAYATASHQGGALSIISAISSLYPVTTIALGRALQGQRATAIQLAGIALALLGAAVLGAAAG